MSSRGMALTPNDDTGEARNMAAMRTRSKSRKYSINHLAPSSKVVIVVKKVENDKGDEDDVLKHSDAEHRASENAQVSSWVSAVQGSATAHATTTIETATEPLVPNLVETLRSKIQEAGAEPQVFGPRADLEHNQKSHAIHPSIHRTTIKVRKLEDVTDSLRMQEVRRRSSANAMSTIEPSLATVVYSPRSLQDQVRRPHWRQQCDVM